jgi:hypothetical protein
VLDRGARVARLGRGANERAVTANAMSVRLFRHQTDPDAAAACQSSALIGDDEAGSARIGCPCDAGRIQRTGETAYPTPSSPTAYSRQRDRAIRIAVRSAVVPSG